MKAALHHEGDGHPVSFKTERLGDPAYFMRRRRSLLDRLPQKARRHIADCGERLVMFRFIRYLPMQCCLAAMSRDLRADVG